jgi:uncharacterized membrane protein YidH (DUF202 family)
VNEDMNSLKKIDFWLALIIVLVTVVLSVAAYLHWIPLSFRIGALFFPHWLAIIGFLFIIIYTPSYYVLKRRHPRKLKGLVQIHVFGNLLSFMLISIHTAQQLGRPPQFYPDLGTGLALYIITLILVATGFLHRYGLLTGIGKYQIPHRNRYVHVALTLSLYIVIIIHVLRNLGLL